MLIVDPLEKRIDWLALRDGGDLADIAVSRRSIRRRLVTAVLPGTSYNTFMRAGSMRAEAAQARWLRRAVAACILALLCGLALAACGGSSTPRTSSSHANVFIAFSKCMRAHGVTNFPDPTGHGINIGRAGIDPRSPAFQAAQKTCFKLLPGGGPNNQKASAARIRQADQTAQCMRTHGVSGFPDPIISTGPPTNLNPANYSSLEAGGGIITAIPKSINEQSPAFERAAKACQFNG